MKKIFLKIASWSFESLILIGLSVAFVMVMAGAWTYSIQLREKVIANSAGMNIDPSPLIEVEKLKSLADAHIADARSFFLLGSQVLMERQKSEKLQFLESLASFERRHNLPGLTEIKTRIEALVKNQDEIFDQAMDFREKKTESKIVGQFYQSKATPIRTKIFEGLDEISKLHTAEFERIKAKSREAGAEAEGMIPEAMKKFTQFLAGIFAAMALLCISMLFKRSRQIADRDRLYHEARQALIDRDEVISAVSQNLQEPLATIKNTVEDLTKASIDESVKNKLEDIRAAAQEIQHGINDIQDQKNAELKSLALRIDQLGIEELFDQAELMLKPLARQRDVRLQFEPVNPPVSAFADRDRVLRILSNLIGNAVKFSPRHSRVLIRARGDQQFINISITDSGPGIPEKQLPKIFDSFWQAKETASDGAGVGLAVVKTLVEAQGGTVRVDSVGGNGCTFTFSLPRRRPVGVQVKKANSTVRTAARPAPISPDGPTA